MDEKVYEPEVIQDNPFPGEVVQPVSSYSPATGVGNYTPTTTKEKTFPVKKVAVELMSTALNTRSKKILQEFELQQTGGLRVGNFEEGISGDLRITPNGLTARDIAGVTTFSIDGTTGDAIFKGVVQAGSIITGGQILNQDGTIIIDEDGLVSQNSFRNGSVFDSGAISTSSDTFVDGGSALTFSLTNTTKVLVMYSALMNNLQAGSNGVQTVMNISVDSVDSQGPDVAGQGVPFSGGVTFISGSASTILSLSSGSHTIKIRYKISTNTGGSDASIFQRQLTYLILGT